MSWIDEQLFGWSQASKPRWSEQSKAGSMVGTPHEEEEEGFTDDADYDQVSSPVLVICTCSIFSPRKLP